ncbi:MAG: queuosine precursor transporter [Flavobacteriales bacterium]|nr:queuosine precursor transporter [Flavobacteriales bacterium]
MKSLTGQKKREAFMLFLFIAGLFITSLVTCNLIFRKFFDIQVGTMLFNANDGGWYYSFQQSVGLLPYPITFLLTDILSEAFGKRKANQVVITGLLCSLFVLFIIWISNSVPAAPWSPVTQDQFSHVFGQTGMAVVASMCAYLVAQFIDIRIFHFWKKLTRGKKLWLRNNFSTMTSQFFDTAVVLLLLCWGGEIEWSKFSSLLLAGFIFKVIVAALDTPILYLAIWMIRKRFGLRVGEEISLT